MINKMNKQINTYLQLFLHLFYKILLKLTKYVLVLYYTLFLLF